MSDSSIDDYWNLNPNPKNHTFNTPSNSKEGEDWIIERDQDYEDHAVKEVMRLLGRKKDIKDLQAKSDDGRINFPMFHEKYPDFPIYLGSKKVYKAYTWDLYQMWRSGFAKSPIWKAYNELYDYAVEDNWQWVGLVLQLPGARYAVFDNYTINTPATYATLVNLYDKTHWIETLKSLISRAGYTVPQDDN